jgi:hypothetical protein
MAALIASQGISCMEVVPALAAEYLSAFKEAGESIACLKIILTGEILRLLVLLLLPSLLVTAFKEAGESVVCLKIILTGGSSRSSSGVLLSCRMFQQTSAQTVAAV